MTLKCLTCLKEFKSVPAAKRKYCSVDCFGKTCRKDKIKTVCAYCKVSFERLKSIIEKSKNSFCSNPCINKLTNEEKKTNAIATLRNNFEINSKGCHIWQGALNHKGYGLINYNGSKLAHRLAYTLLIKDPVKKLVCHTCDEPSCVAISHLFIGTAQENSSDMFKKGRSNNKLKGRSNISLTPKKLFTKTT